jgi:hypothetical protein
MSGIAAPVFSWKDLPIGRKRSAICWPRKRLIDATFASTLPKRDSGTAAYCFTRGKKPSSLL